jgi:hypothetical protein
MHAGHAPAGGAAPLWWNGPAEQHTKRHG